MNILGFIKLGYLSVAHLQKLGLVQNLHAKLLRLSELGTGFGTGHHKIRFLAHAACHFAARDFKLW
jgi:hypothetical protein